MSRVRKGLNREHHVVKGKVVSVKYYDTENPVTAFVVRDEKAEAQAAEARKRQRQRARRGTDEVVIEMGTEMPLVVVNHYEGVHTATPKGNPIAVSEYAPLGPHHHLRLIRQYAAKGGPGGKAVTAFFHYENETKHFPAAAFVFWGNVKSIQEARDHIRCMTLAYDSGSGNVSAASLFCKNKEDRHEPPREIEAVYEYEDRGVGAPLVRASFHDTREGWSMTVQYAASVSGEDAPHIAYVDYTDPRRVKYRTHFSYTHPLHPTMSTMKVCVWVVVPSRLARIDTVARTLIALVHLAAENRQHIAPACEGGDASRGQE